MRNPATCIVASLIWTVISLLVVSGDGYAQQSFYDSSGMQVQFQQENTAQRTAPESFHAGFYTRHNWSRYLFGELGASIGIFSRADLKIRQIPLEYRMNLFLDRRERRTGSDARVSPYLFAGGGWLFFHPVERPVEADPLIPDQESLRSSPNWQFESGNTIYIPVGIGFQRPLTDAAGLDLRLGYRYNLQPDKLSQSVGTASGMFEFSVGLRFSRSPKVSTSPAASPPRLSRIPVPVEKSLVPVESIEHPAIEDFPVDEVTGMRFSYDVGSSTLDSSGLQLAVRLAEILQRHPNRIVVVNGHTDSTGPDQLNELLSWNRARAVYFELLEHGVNATRVTYQGWMDERPIADNRSVEGRRLNRRADIELIDKEALTDEIPDSRVGKLVEIEEYQYLKPLIDPSQVEFEANTARPSKETRQRVREIHLFLSRHEGVDLMIVSRDHTIVHESLRREVTRARSGWIGSQLIRHGVDPARIQMYDHLESESLSRLIQQLFDRSVGQELFLIPLVGGGSE